MTDPVVLHSDGDMVVLHVVLPAILALHHLPVRGGEERDLSNVVMYCNTI